jgi:hypothetical protein
MQPLIMCNNHDARSLYKILKKFAVWSKSYQIVVYDQTTRASQDPQQLPTLARRQLSLLTTL